MNTVFITENESELLERAQKGDVPAFNTLVCKYKSTIYGYCLACTQYDESSADDLFQEAIIRAFIFIKKYRGTAAFTTWVYRIVKNKFISMMREEQVRATLKFDDSTIELELASIRTLHCYNPASICLEKDLKSILENILSNSSILSPRLSEILKLKFINELSTEEIAKKLGLTKGSIKTAVSQGRRKIMPVILKLVS